MSNRGVAPLDPETLVGEFRLLYGDTQYTELDPAEPGYGDYTELSDAEIEMFLKQSGNAVARAISIYYGRLAGDAAKVGKSIKDHDLALDNMRRYEGLLASSRYWADLADEEGADFFVIAPTAYRALGSGCGCDRPELTHRLGCSGANVL